MEQKQEGKRSPDHILTVEAVYLPPSQPLLATEERLSVYEAVKISLKLLVPTSGSSFLVAITAGASVKIIGLLGPQYNEATSLTTLLEYTMLPFSAMLTPVITMTARVNPAHRVGDQIPAALGHTLRNSYTEQHIEQAHPSETGKIAHAGMVVATVLIAPLSLIFRYSGEILNGLRQPLELTPIASEFCQPYIGGIPGYFYTCVASYIANPLGLQMRVFLAQLACGAAGIGIGALLLLKTDLAVQGMSIGIDIQYTATFLGLLGYYLYKNKTDPQFREFGLFKLHAPTLREHLKSLLPYIKEILKFGVFVSIFAFIELSNFFLTTLFVGWHGAPQLAAQLTVQIWLLLVGIINYSLGEVANLLVGKYHAAGRTTEMRLFANVCMLECVVWNALWLILFETAPGPLTSIFLNGDVPIEAYNLAIPLLMHIAPSSIFHGLGLVSGGAARGLTRVAMTAFTSGLSNIALNIPLIYFLSIKLDYGLPGMAWALNISRFVGMVIQMVYWYYLADSESGISSRLTRTIDCVMNFIKDKLLCCCRRRPPADEPILLQSTSRNSFFTPPTLGHETDTLIKSASLNTDPEEPPPRKGLRDYCVIC